MESLDGINRILELGYGPIVRDEFRKMSVPADWGMAIARIESGFDPTAIRNIGGDGMLGGAWGLCQMTLVTATTELGYTGDGPGLLDPRLNACLAATLCRHIIGRLGHDILDVAAAYNSGKSYLNAKPKVKKYADMVAAFARGYAGKFDDELIESVT